MKKSKKRQYLKRKHNKTVKRKREILVPSKTPKIIRNISNRIAGKLASNSYSPTINNELVSLKYFLIKILVY